MDEQKDTILNAIIKCRDELMQDQYGNYVLQQAIVTGFGVQHLLPLLADQEY